MASTRAEASHRSDILVIGAGELGMAVLRALAPAIGRADTLTALRTPASASTTSPTNDELTSLGVRIIGVSLADEDVSDLAAHLGQFDTVVNCTGFVAGPGTQLKITEAVLRGGVARYVPWQFGVDYDTVGRGSGQPVFDEQLDVRHLLRAQQTTEWVIVSTGMFTSFLFEPSFGVVDIERSRVNGLGAWSNQVTLTTPDDIGKLTSSILLDVPRVANEIVYVAGDTISYGRLADIVEQAAGRPFERTAWSQAELDAAVTAAPDDAMARYRAAFAKGEGMWWDMTQTYNYRRGIPTTDVETWLQARLDTVVADSSAR